MEGMKNQEILERIRGGLIVSCQALPEEPLHSSYIMARMAYAAYEGGAAGIRANTVEDIREIRRAVPLPVIGIIKKVYGTCGVYITPTRAEVDTLVKARVEIIAIDATDRLRPDGKSLAEFFTELRSAYPDQLFMADCSNVAEGIRAEELGFDLIGTTLAGDRGTGCEEPAFDMMRELVGRCEKPVIAEGGIWTPEQLRHAMDTGVLAAVIGSAITRPREITRRFIKALEVRG